MQREGQSACRNLLALALLTNPLLPLPPPFLPLLALNYYKFFHMNLTGRPPAREAFLLSGSIRQKTKRFSLTNGSADHIALDNITAYLAEFVQLGFCFDPFRHDSHFS